MAEQRGLHDDRERGDQPAPDDQKPRQTILAQEIESGLNELERPADGLLLSGLSAGLDIGFGPLFMAVLTTLVATSWGNRSRKSSWRTRTPSASSSSSSVAPNCSRSTPRWRFCRCSTGRRRYDS